MRVNLGTTTTVAATGLATQRRIVKTTEGKLVLFALINKTLACKTSTDNGVTWDSSWTNIDLDIISVSVYIGSNNDIYLLYLQEFYGYITYFRKLTYIPSSQAWTIGKRVYVWGGYSNPSIVIIKRSNGDLCAACVVTGSGTRYRYSSDEGSSWSDLGGLISIPDATAVGLIPYGNNLRSFVQVSGEIRVYEFITSWTRLSNVTSSGITSGSRSLGYVRISDSEIYVTGRTASGIRVFRWNGSSWDTGVLLSSRSEDIDPSVSNVDSKPIVCWTRYDGTKYDIVYRRWNGSSWDPPVKLTDDTVNDFRPSTLESDVGTLYVCYTTGNASPYTVYFDKVVIYVPPVRKTITSDAKVKVFKIPENISSTAKIVDRNQETISSEAKIKIAKIQETIESDAKIKYINQEIINSDASIIASIRRNISSDAKVKVIGEQGIIESDARIIIRGKENISSDAKIKVTKIRETILSGAKVCIWVLTDIANRIRIVKQSLIDTINDFRLTKRVLSDIENIIIAVKFIFYNVNNDFRTKKLITKNIANDFRMIKPWQRAGAAGFQSLGKSYINVFINDLEVTDVNIDSISINRAVDSPATATFDLARPYDAQKPDLESTVKIMYKDWILFKGYIVSIRPSDNPEHITIDCNDKYWRDNQTHVYFYVGHKPKDADELYYRTIHEALVVLGCNFSIGKFIPQTIDCFGVGKIDAINDLVRQSGNFEIYYDVDNNIKLCTAGQGSIISLELQQIGKNLGLYQVLNHQFTEDISGIINRFRVQMGDRVVKADNRRIGTSTGGRSKSQQIYRWYYYHGYARPDWDSKYEILAKYSGDGYGFDYHIPQDAWKYNKVFKKYELPYLDKDTSKWSDIRKPVVEIQGGRYGDVWLPNIEVDVIRERGFFGAIYAIKEGFTIDYEEGVLRFNEPIFIYTTDKNGECTSVRAPQIILHLWKEDYLTKSPKDVKDPEDPIFEEDRSNPLMFFTEKMGDYPKIITGSLDLSSLSIQIGYSYRGFNIGKKDRVPSWDDTEFAKDQANWQLSKVCDPKIRGFVEISLDAFCFYNIELENRIFIKEIMKEPLNIESINLSLNDFRVRLQLKNARYYRRTISIQSRE